MTSKDIELLQYECILTPLTPIQIGNGNDLSPFEYVIKNNKYYRIDINEFMEKIPENIKNQFLKILEENSMFTARKFLKNNYKEEYGYLYKCSVSSEYSQLYEKKIGGVLNKNDNNELTVGEFIGTEQGKYIPGSTLKGGFRTAYLAGNFDSEYFYKLYRQTENKYGKKIDTKPLKSVLNKDIIGKKIEAGILGLENFDVKFDPFKNFKVTDTEIKNDIIEVRDILRKGIKKEKCTEMPMGSFEVTKSLFGSNENINLNFQISVKNIAREAEKIYIKSSIKKNNNYIPIVKNTVSFYIDTELIFSLKEKAEKILEEDIKFFEKINDTNSLKFCYELKKYNESLEENQALIRIGRGAGFNSTTFNLYNEKIEKISTRVTVNDMPIGWAVITFKEI